jgi:hypothetical protein
MIEVSLPSGAVLKIGLAPFDDSKNLYQAILEELKGVQISSTREAGDVLKDLACVGLSSKKIESCLWACLKRCTYNDGKGDFIISKETFEPVKAREDYFTVCLAVAKENINPFMKNLFVEYQKILAVLTTTAPT